MDVDRTANLLGALALALSDAIQAAVERQAPESGGAAAALALVHHEPGMPIERVRRSLGLSHPGTVRLIDRLAGVGLLRRRPSGTDRRAVALFLTPKGKKTVDRIHAERRKVLVEALSSLLPEEQAVLERLLERTLSHLVGGIDQAYAICRLCQEDACKACPVEAALSSESAQAT